MKPGFAHVYLIPGSRSSTSARPAAGVCPSAGRRPGDHVAALPLLLVASQSFPSPLWGCLSDLACHLQTLLKAGTQTSSTNITWGGWVGGSHRRSPQ